MTIQLIDRNYEMTEHWRKEFASYKDVVIHQGDIFSLQTDCIVSPANSFGFMDGGLDLVLSEVLGPDTQKSVQQKIVSEHTGELLVGNAVIVETGFKAVPYCISAPTMRVPMSIKGTVNAYLSTKAVFSLLSSQPHLPIKKVTMSGMGAGAGNMPYEICAKQMKQAYEHFWLRTVSFPKSWVEARKHHEALLI